MITGQWIIWFTLWKTTFQTLHQEIRQLHAVEKRYEGGGRSNCSSCICFSRAYYGVGEAMGGKKSLSVWNQARSPLQYKWVTGVCSAWFIWHTLSASASTPSRQVSHGPFLERPKCKRHMGFVGSRTKAPHLTLAAAHKGAGTWYPRELGMR